MTRLGLDDSQSGYARDFDEGPTAMRGDALRSARRRMLYTEDMTLEQDIKSLALELGFDRVGITDAEPFARDEAAAVERVRGPG